MKPTHVVGGVIHGSSHRVPMMSSVGCDYLIPAGQVKHHELLKAINEGRLERPAFAEGGIVFPTDAGDVE